MLGPEVLREVTLPRARIPRREVTLSAHILSAFTLNTELAIQTPQAVILSVEAAMLSMKVANQSTGVTQITIAALPTGHPHLP